MASVVRNLPTILFILLVASLLAAGLRFSQQKRFNSRSSAEAQSLCRIATPRLQVGSTREVVEFLQAALFSETAPEKLRAQISLIENENIILRPHERASEYESFECVVPGRNDIQLALMFPRIPIMSRDLLLYFLVISFSLAILYLSFRQVVAVAQNQFVETFEAALSQRLGLPHGGVSKNRFFSMLDRLFLMNSSAIRDAGLRILALEKEIARQTSAISRANSAAAIARMAQMLIHDIRRPFSVLKTGIKMIRKTLDTPEKNLRTLELVDSELSRALSEVEVMIVDLMALGSDQISNQEYSSASELIRDALSAVFSEDRVCFIDFHYDLLARKVIFCDKTKIKRVLVNVIENGVQAMSATGEMWFESRDIEVDGKSLVEIAIGNNGPAIDSADVERLFELFFTKGKRNGTGLGLAAAKSIVEAHGGSIECVSSEFHGTVFTIKLMGEVVPNHAGNFELPRHSSDINKLSLKDPNI